MLFSFIYPLLLEISDLLGCGYDGFSVLVGQYAQTARIAVLAVEVVYACFLIHPYLGLYELAL